MTRGKQGETAIIGVDGDSSVMAIPWEEFLVTGIRHREIEKKNNGDWKKAKEIIKSGRWPCGCCGRGVGANSVLCVACNKWCHQRCSGLRNLRGIQNFVCPRCTRVEEDDEDEDARLIVDGGVLDEVQQFSYLGDVLDCEAGVERAVRSRVAIAWARWREISSLLVNHNIGLRSRGRVYEACVRSALLYGAETWALTS